MRLKDIASIHPGYLNRSKIQPNEQGSHRLIQVRDVEAGVLQCSAATLIQFTPELSSRDKLLQNRDILFMARGDKNYAALLSDVTEPTLAAASFFIIRVSSRDLEPAYLAWYLNQPRAQHYFTRNSGQGVLMPVVRRSVLEHLEVPLPSVATQRQIADVYSLLLDEQELTRALLAKRARLMEAVCLQTAERDDS